MKTQNQIKRTLSEPASIEIVCGLLEGNDILHRTEMAVAVCDMFGFHDPRGKPQAGGCLKALRELEAYGHFTLPGGDGSRKRKARTPRRTAKPVARPVKVPSQARDVRALKLVLVTDDRLLRIWNELMVTEHPLGVGPLVGRQVRYLVESDHGWLGGLGFAAAALQLGDRDRWIGWDREQRRAHLHYVVQMSRFLIRPKPKQCRNLASKVLGMAVEALPDDFARQYGYRPLLLESFVDTSRYSGACYRAANWLAVGKTKGRGRQDRDNRYALSVKAIYVYAVESDFRKQMGLSADAGLGPLGPDQGLDSGRWAENEFGGAQLGDARLNKRLVKVAKAKAEGPDRAFSGVAEGDWPKVKAYYRMIDQPDDSAVNMESILAPHRQRTVRRMMGQKVVLCIQDGSDLNYNNLNQCEGLGNIGKNQTGAKRRGLHLHSTFTVAPNGLPLGVLRACCQAPRDKDPEDRRYSKDVAIEEKVNNR